MMTQRATLSRRASFCLSLVAVLLCLSSLTAAHAWSDNLLLNPGFEEENNHWGAYADWGTPDPYPEAKATQDFFHSGLWSLRVGPPGGGRSQTVVKPRPNTTYKLTAWGRVSQLDEVGWVGVECYDIYGARSAPGLEFTSTSYQYQEMQFTTPATIDFIRVFAWKEDGPGYLYVDDVSLVGPDLQASPGSTTYYLDSVSGSDGNAGTSPAAAWQTLDKVNSVIFAPGDSILFRANCAWTGQLDPYGSGAPGNPIVVAIYVYSSASDALTDAPSPSNMVTMPLIDGQGLVTAPLRLYNQEHWEVSNLELSNYDGGFARTRFGAWIAAEDAGLLTHIHLKGLDIHDVNGLLDDGSKVNGGIGFDIRGLGIETMWDDILVEGCTVTAADRSGIWLSSWWWDRNIADGQPGCWVPSTNVVLRSNIVDDIGGDGIVPCICDGPLVEYNVAKDCNKRSGRYCVGIWSWACDDTLIQYNEAYLTRTTNDGEGFDSDWFSHNTNIQYNYSHDNEGGFCLVCANGEYSGFNDGTIVRYNISQNDHARAFHIPGPCTNTSIYNNTIYIGEGLSSDPIVHSSWGGYADNTHCYNNIFYNLGTGDYYFASSTNNFFDYNVFYGNHPASEPSDPHKLTDDPKFVNPGSAAVGRDTCAGYQLLPSSPCIDSGMEIATSGGLDFFDNPVPTGLAMDRGAHEYHQFPDVLSDHWAFQEIGACLLAGIVKGFDDGLYRPGMPVTREQMAIYISRALVGGDANVPDGPAQATFDDVPTDHWAYKCVEYCFAEGVVQGYTETTYAPLGIVNREQMAVFIARALAGSDADVPDGPAQATFDDVPTDHWAYKYVEYCVAEGVVQGYTETTYGPLDIVNREQMAVFITRAFQLPL